MTDYKNIADIHEDICNQAADIGNRLIEADVRIPPKWKGRVLEGFSQYSGSSSIENGFSLRIVDAYATAPAQWHERYRRYAVAAVRQAIANNQELWVGAILADAREGTNYFNRWEQAPEALF
jgi:hypothetical protein